MDKKRVSKALDFEAVPKRSQSTDERRPAGPSQGAGGPPRKGLPGPYDPPPGSQAGHAYRPPMTGSRGVIAITAVPPPADATITGGPARSQTMPSNRGRLGGGTMSSQSSAGTAMGGSGNGRSWMLGQGQKAGLNLTSSKPVPRPAYVPNVPPVPISSGPSPTGPLPNPPRAAPLCLAKPSPQQQQQQAPLATHPQPVYQPHAPSQQAPTQPAARLNTQPPTYRPRTSTSPRPDAPQQGPIGGHQPPPIPNGPSQASQAMAMSSPMTMPTPQSGDANRAASSVSPIYPPKPPASYVNQGIFVSQSVPRPPISQPSQPSPAIGTGCPEYRPGVPPSSQQRTAVGLGGARMNGGGGGLSQRGLSQPTPAYQPRTAFKGSIKPVPQPHTPDSATSPGVTGPIPSPSGDAAAMQQEVQRLQASLAKMEEERRKAEEKAQALSEALNQKEADALELKLCLTMEEAERNTVLKDMADLKQQLTFKDQDLRNAELLRARAEQEVMRRKRKNPGSVTGDDDDDCSRVSTSSPDGKAKSRPIGGGSPPKPMLVDSKVEEEGGAGGYGVPGVGLAQGVPPDTLQLSSSLREFADHICCLLSSNIVSSKGVPSSGRPSEDQDVFLLRLASTLRPKSASQGHGTHAMDMGKAEAVCATLATQLYQALTVATSGGPTHLPAVLQCLASYMHVPEIVGRTRLLSALYIARGLICMSAECRRSIKLPAESVEGATAQDDGGFTSRYRGPPLPPAHPTRAAEEAGSAIMVDLPPSVLPVGGGGFLGVLRSLLASLVKDVSEGGEEAELSSPLVHQVLGILLTLAHETREGQDAGFWSAVLDDGALHTVLMNGLKGRQVEVVTVWIEILQCLVQHPGLFHQLRVLRQGGFFSDVSHQVMTWHVDQRWDGRMRPLVDCLTLRVLRLLTGVFVKYGVAGRELVWARGGKAEQQKSAIRLLPSLIHVLNQEVTVLISTKHDATQSDRAIHLTIARESFVLFSLLGTQQEQTHVLKDIILRTNVKWTLAAIHFRLMNNMVDPSLSDLSEEAEYWTEVLEGN